MVKLEPGFVSRGRQMGARPRAARGSTSRSGRAAWFAVALAALMALNLPAPAGATMGGASPTVRNNYYFIDSIDPASPKPSYLITPLGGGSAYSFGASLDAAITGIPIGFAFKFYDVTYTAMDVNSAGIVSFGGVPYAGPHSPSGAMPGPFNRAIYGASADYDAFDDFCTTASPLRINTLGIAPARMTVVYFVLMMYESLDGFSCDGGGPTPDNIGKKITFQVKLYETSNVIEVHWQSHGAPGPNTWQATNAGVAVGIQRDASTYLQYFFAADPTPLQGRAVRFRPANSAPVAVADAGLATPMNTALNVDVLANDVAVPGATSPNPAPGSKADPDNVVYSAAVYPASPANAADNAVNVVLDGIPVGGTASVNADKTITFVPANNFCGAASLSYHLENVNTFASYVGNSVPVSIAVNACDPANTPPTVTSCTPNMTSAVTGQTVTYTVVSTDSDGTVQNHDWTFPPNPGTVTAAGTTQGGSWGSPGTYTATVSARDNLNALSAPFNCPQVTVTLAGANVPPFANAKGYTAVLGGSLTTSSSVQGGLMGSVGDTDGSIAASDAFQTCTAVGVGALSSISDLGHFTYTPVGTTPYQTTFTYQVQDNLGMWSTCATVTIDAVPNKPPTAQFDAAPSQPRVGEPVTFVDTSKDPDQGDHVAAWTWTFGDGATSGASNPTHIYGKAGSYQVCLVAVDTRSAASPTKCTILGVRPAAPLDDGSDGSDDSGDDGDSGEGDGGPGDGKTLEVTLAAPTAAAPGSKVTLTATSTAAGTAYTWEQVSGPRVDLDVTGAAASFTAPHGAGQQAFGFMVTGTKGSATDQAVALVTIQAAQEGPVARLAGPSETEAGDRITLDASASTDPAGRDLAFAWTQAAGPTASFEQTSLPRASITLPEPGVYVFLLTVGSGAGSATALHTVTVAAGEAGDAQAAPGFRSTTVGPTVSVTPTVAARAYTWDFGDDSPPVTTQGSATHAYASAGDYEIHMVAHDADGGAQAYTGTAKVDGGQERAVGPVPDPGSAGVPLWAWIAGAALVLALAGVAAALMMRRGRPDAETAPHG